MARGTDHVLRVFPLDIALGSLVGRRRRLRKRGGSLACRSFSLLGRLRNGRVDDVRVQAGVSVIKNVHLSSLDRGSRPTALLAFSYFPMSRARWSNSRHRFTLSQ